MTNPELSAAASVADMLPDAKIVITQAMIDAYAAISGDFNPLHVDPVMAAASPFGTTIAHGCIPMEPIFQSLQRWIGRPVLPASSTMKLRYHRPSRPGDTIRIEARTSSEPAEQDAAATRISFACRNQHGEMVIDGECEVPASQK